MALCCAVRVSEPALAHCDSLLTREALSNTAAMRIPGRAGPYGVVIVGARQDRTYSRADLVFVHAVANVLGAAFERAAMDRDLRRELALYSATVEAAADGTSSAMPADASRVSTSAPSRCGIHRPTCSPAEPSSVAFVGGGTESSPRRSESELRRANGRDIVAGACRVLWGVGARRRRGVALMRQRGSEFDVVLRHDIAEAERCRYLRLTKDLQPELPIVTDQRLHRAGCGRTVLRR
jgi:hypothetical protein